VGQDALQPDNLPGSMDHWFRGTNVDGFYERVPVLKLLNALEVLRR
jgi:hypothetical protein